MKGTSLFGGWETWYQTCLDRSFPSLADRTAGLEHPRRKRVWPRESDRPRWFFSLRLLFVDPSSPLVRLHCFDKGSALPQQTSSTVASSTRQDFGHHWSAELASALWLSIEVWPNSLKDLWWRCDSDATPSLIALDSRQYELQTVNVQINNVP